MKKLICLCLAFMLFLLSACSMINESTVPSTDPMDAYLSQIYEIYDSGYESNEENMIFNHTNIISDDLQYTFEKDVVPNTVFQTNKRAYSLNYVSTIYYPVGERTIREYSVDGYDGSLYLHDDGSVALITFDFMELDIAKSDSPEVVLAKLKPAISDIIDISNYQNIRIMGYTPGELDFGTYTFMLYNIIHGYRSDIAYVAVSSDGSVCTLSVANGPCCSPDKLLDIDKELEEEIIISKLKNIYNTADTEYRRYDTNITPNIQMYNNELCIEYTVGCHVYSKSRDSEFAVACHLLIPVRLLINTEYSVSAT